jgi:hypothetical protein
MFNYGTKFAGLGIGTFPNFAAKNASGPTATDGFPYTADSVNDWIGFTQDLLNRAGLTPNGQAEANGSSQLINALMRNAARCPGEVIYTAISTQALRAQSRLLDLAGQIISITGDYARVAAAVYCGDSLNAAAPAFYKCDASGARSTSGAYMKLPDCRGLFLRGAGQNDEHMMANDAPYDGGAIGSYLADQLQNHKHSAGINAEIALTGKAGPWGFAAGNWTLVTAMSITVNNPNTGNYGNETRPASTSVYVCITY